MFVEYFKVISSCRFKIKISFSPNYTSTIEIPQSKRSPTTMCASCCLQSFRQRLESQTAVSPSKGKCRVWHSTAPIERRMGIGHPVAGALLRAQFGKWGPAASQRRAGWVILSKLSVGGRSSPGCLWVNKLVERALYRTNKRSVIACCSN